MISNYLIKKLNFKEGDGVVIRNLPEGLASEIKNSGLVLVDPSTTMKLDGALFFVQDQASLSKLFPEIQSLVGSQTIIWLVYPKGGSGVKTNVNRDKLWQLMEPIGLRPNRQIAVDETWSAMRFKKSEEPLPSSPVRNQNREMRIPEDFQEAISQSEIISGFFNSLSYTNRKEYVNWIEDAKKTETRTIRIEKAVKLLLEKKKLNN